MATISIYQGDADTLIETITGLSSLSGYSAKMYIKTIGGVAVATLTGSISGLVITYQIVNENSKSYTIGDHLFETKIWDSNDHVYTPTKGEFKIKKALNNDPS